MRTRVVVAVGLAIVGAQLAWGSSTRGAGEVRIEVGQSAVTRMAGQPAGTRYVVATGVHQGTFANVQPRAGDTFACEPRAVIDGGDTLSRAFGGTASDVTITGCKVRHYRPGSQRGAVEPGGNGWLLRDDRIVNNRWAGVYVSGDDLTIGGGAIKRNDHLGIGDDRADRTVVGNVTIKGNGALGSCGFEAGGYKWVGDDTVVLNSRIEANHCKGLWADIGGNNSWLHDNVIRDNTDEGVFIEISDGARVERNIVERNGLDPCASGTRECGEPGNTCQWLWGGGITNSESDHVTVEGNTLAGNCNGITGVSIGRPDEGGHLANYLVRSNTVDGPGYSGVAADDGVDLSTRNIVYSGNSFTGGHVFCGLTC